MRIFLTGFMGSGKSYTAQRLAALVGYPFLDLDDWIEEINQQTIAELFEHRGEEGFRQLEKQTLRQLEQLPNLVLATGGGTPCFDDNMEWMKQQGITIYLRTSIDILFQRLRPEIAHRPLLQGKNDEALRYFIEQKLSERVPCYEKAHLIIDQTEANSDLAELIYRQLSQITGH